MAPKRNGIPPARLAACEPCRDSKVACDHAQPVCTRCREREGADRCVYRSRPFKRRRDENPSSANRLSNGVPKVIPNSTGQNPVAISHKSPASMTSQSPSSGITLTSEGLSNSPHPNPGYLGSSSYVTIFEQMAANRRNSQAPIIGNAQSDAQGHRSPVSRVSDSIVAEGTRLLEEIKSSGMFPQCSSLMERWFARGSNIALASQFSRQCVNSTCELVASLQNFPATEVSRRLSHASDAPLAIENDIDAFIESFTGVNTRWETLSLCFLMFPRATFYIDSVDGLFHNTDERQKIRKKAISLSDQCLEVALSLDCLNDLQLMIQYENFIAHSYVDGDQSYNSWRKLGDVASSLYALGYHDDVTGRPPVPLWLQDLRKSSVARAYSADKNVAIFLGRPPRIHHKFFSTKVLGIMALNLTEEVSTEIWQLEALNHPTFCYDVDTWWSAMCARLKEEALDLSRELSQDEQARKASLIEAHAQAQWEALPARYYLTGSLKAYSSDPRERDFVVGAKLNHLHVLFITLTAQARFVPEPNHQLVSISATMLSMVTEAIVLRTYLSNSGTTLMWKLIYYGLPAAGIICLYLLDRSLASKFHTVPRTKALQDLNVLVAQIESRAFTDTEDPNFNLLSSAAKTMQAIIEKLLSGYWTHPVEDVPVLTSASAGSALMAQNSIQRDTLSDQNQDQLQQNALMGVSGVAVDDASSQQQQQQQWLAWNNGTIFQDFEADFWLNLADHPALGG